VGGGQALVETVAQPLVAGVAQVADPLVGQVGLHQGVGNEAVVSISGHDHRNARVVLLHVQWLYQVVVKWLDGYMVE
jgi:hypothetical protein